MTGMTSGPTRTTANASTSGMTGLTGMALAAGLGARMRPFTDSRPKPLIAVGGMTLLDHALNRLEAAGAARIVVNVHYLADQIEAHLRTRIPPPEILVSDERALLLETGGGLVKARPLFGAGPVIVTNTDAIFLPDAGAPDPWADLFAGFDPAREDARLILVPKARATGLAGSGDFDLAPDGRLRRREPGRAAAYFYTGIQMLNPAILDGWPVEPFSLNRIWDRSLAEGRLSGAVFPGDWLHVGDPAGLAAAGARLSGGAR